jgi:hypothetical protein
VTLAADCEGQWTVFGTCVPNNCPLPTGACCLPSNLCSVLTEAACATDGGWYLGNGAECAPDPCAQLRVGACWTTARGCAFVPESVCLASGGQFAGPGTDCSAPIGACCDVSTGTCTITTAAACQFSWLGAGTLCNVVICAPPAMGACCNTATGACTITAQAACAFTWRGAGTACDLQTCPAPGPGACCFRNAYCRILSMARCEVLRGIFVGGVCTPSSNPPCYVLGGPMGSGMPPDESSPAEEKGSWGQIKNRYR